MKRRSIMRTYGLIATAILALLVLPTAALSFPVEPGKGDLEAGGPDKKQPKQGIPVKITIHLKFFTPKGWKTAEQRKWITQAKWWVKRINRNCETKKIGGVKNEGRDRDTIPRSKTDFASNGDLLTASDPDKEKFFIGDAKLVGVIGANKSTRFFNIGIFKTVRVKSQFAGSAGTVPGKYIAPNVMVASKYIKRCDRRHELGHLMGLKHRDRGLMHKNNPKKGASKKSGAWYGDKQGGCDDFVKSWCPIIAAHLGL